MSLSTSLDFVREDNQPGVENKTEEMKRLHFLFDTCARMSVLLILSVLLVAYQFYKFFTCVPPNSPPCIPRFPVVGSYLHLLWRDYLFPYKSVRYYINKLQSKVLTCYLGPFITIIANDYNSIKEVLTNEDFDGRPTTIDVVLARAFGKKLGILICERNFIICSKGRTVNIVPHFRILGIFFTEGLFWQEQRRFSLRHMRDFGFGRRQEKYEADMMEELALLVQMLKEGPINDKENTFLKNGSALFPDILYPYCANAVWNIAFGERLDRADHDKLRYFCESAMLFQKSNDTTGGAIFQFWFLKYFGNMFGYKNILKGNAGMMNFIKEHLERRKNEGNDFDRGMVDRYLEVLKEIQASDSSFSEEQLILTLVDFMFPAISAIPSALVHAIKLVMHHPRVLKNMKDELDKVVGTGRLVKWDDRKSLPYTEATLRESLRYETLTPFGVFHKALKDTKLSGFDVPKNALVVTNLFAMNTDSDLWGDPENFRPERFLREDGQLGKDFSFPFGFGHRVCAGETFARYNMFSLFSTLIQNFNLSFLEGEPTGIEDKIPGLITIPRQTWIKVEPRG